MQRIACIWLTAALTTAWLAGCQDQAAQTYPADPLLNNKRPIEAKADNAAPVSVAAAEPAMPTVPPLVLATAQQHGRNLTDLTGQPDSPADVHVLRPTLP
jgi:hypothetical protein